MGRGAWQATVHGVTKELDMTQQLNKLLIYLATLGLSCSMWDLHCLSSVQFSSVAQSCPTLCDPTDCSSPGLPVHSQLPEFTQTHVH